MMNDRPERGQDRAAGLCATCVHARIVVTDRGSRFIRCQRADTDSAYARYPVLPVRMCPGHDERGFPVS